MSNNLNKTLKISLLLKKADVKCTYCSKELDDNKDCTLDHVLPKSQGGTNNLKNLVICCNDCNRKKSDLLLTQFIKAFDIEITKEIASFL